MLVKNVKMIDVSDWDNLVSDTYGRIYNFQQQNGCQERGTFHLTVPSDYTEDDEMNESIPEEVNGDEMGVKFKNWLEKDPESHNFGSNWKNELFGKEIFIQILILLRTTFIKKV